MPVYRLVRLFPAAELSRENVAKRGAAQTITQELIADRSAIGNRADCTPLGYSVSDTHLPNWHRFVRLHSMGSERTIRERISMMNKVSSRFLVTMAVLLAGVSFASATQSSSRRK